MTRTQLEELWRNGLRRTLPWRQTTPMETATLRICAARLLLQSAPCWRRSTEVDKLPIPSTEKTYFYVPSLSSNTLIYKGMLIADQIEAIKAAYGDKRDLVLMDNNTVASPKFDKIHSESQLRRPIRSRFSGRRPCASGKIAPSPATE